MAQELDAANWWFDLSSFGLLVAGAVTAVGAIASVYFSTVQTRSSGIRDRYAEQRTRTLELETAEARRDTANAKVRIKELNLLVAEANARAAEAGKAAELERSERLRLERQVAPRRLTPMQQAIITQVMRQTSCSVHVLWTDNAEAILFGQDFVRVFSTAGCHVTHQGGNVIHGSPFFGIIVVPGDTFVERALRAAEIPCEIRSRPAASPHSLGSIYPNGMVSLHVGLRPPPL